MANDLRESSLLLHGVTFGLTMVHARQGLLRHMNQEPRERVRQPPNAFLDRHHASLGKEMRRESTNDDKLTYVTSTFLLF